MNLLSTKKLNSTYKDQLSNIGINVIEVPMIKTVSIGFDWPKVQESIILTSSNSLKVLKNNSRFDEILNTPFFCVGKNTKRKLINLGIKVVECENSSIELANKIISKYPNMSFNYFCGKIRLPQLEDNLKSANIFLITREVYDTISIPKIIDQDFDSVLFFSPSGVKSYASRNSFDSKFCFSWGKTTSKEIIKNTNNFVTSNQPTMKSMISIIKKHLNKP
ncbi:MAG: hypothetical protein CMC79_03490 [Flavobacteriaceae bacterium]|nr:hypothetical protein [Flavobacteriaceae bacterium]|tara:strand:+ start:7983 stop:8642 length:660 start_codon:yes stop_codon:yes gene_type:complete